jgi:hypothetical protein
MDQIPPVLPGGIFLGFELYRLWTKTLLVNVELKNMEMKVK